MKKSKKTCKHEWVYDEALKFYVNSWQMKGDIYYRAVWHCKKCQQVDVQTIYK
jgi:hypothetical protein